MVARHLTTRSGPRLAGLLVLLAPLLSSAAHAGDGPLAITCAKVLTMDDEGRVFTPGLVLARDGKIEYVGPPREIPEGYEHIERPDAWAIPGMIDLHSHIHSGGWGDINDMVLPINCDLKASAGFRPSNRLIRVACASGVTTLLGIPGSGTSISGFGILYKTKTDTDYAGATVADPGGMKVAQSHNPERGAGDLGLTRAGLSWILEDANRKAVAANEQDRVDPVFANLQRVHAGELPVLIHCAGSDGVAAAGRMWRDTFDTRSVISHGSFDGWYTAKYLASLGIPVNHGPRIMNWSFGTREERIVGTAAEFVKAGVPLVSLNTDSGVIPQEYLFLQGSMSARLGADAYTMLKAVTIHPAKSFGLDDRLGSLEVGKDADIVLKVGDPLDPRVRVELVVIDGQIEYDPETDGQWF